MSVSRAHKPPGPLPEPLYIDLHIHSTASDGSLSPADIIKAACTLGLRAISITDHDTVEGSVEAMRLQHACDLEILPGIELSASFENGSLHVLGYLIGLDHGQLKETLKLVQEARHDRNLKIIEKLQDLGVAIDYDEVLAVSGGGQTGRPHIAQVLVEKKVVRTIDEAFSKFLKRGCPAHAQRYRLMPAEAIKTILDAGGVPVLAHPFTLDTKGGSAMERTLAELKEDGLKGLEVYYPGHGHALTSRYESLARRYGLIITGGSDFHGIVNPDIHIGVGRGDLRIPYRLVEGLRGVKLSVPSSGFQVQG